MSFAVSVSMLITMVVPPMNVSAFDQEFQDESTQIMYESNDEENKSADEIDLIPEKEVEGDTEPAKNDETTIVDDNRVNINSNGNSNVDEQIQQIKTTEKAVKKPELILSKSTNDWTNQNIVIDVKSEGFGSVIKSVSFDNEEKPEEGRNLLKNSRYRENTTANNSTDTPTKNELGEEDGESYIRTVNQKDTAVSVYDFFKHPNSKGRVIEDMVGADEYKVGEDFTMSVDVRVPKDTKVTLGLTLRKGERDPGEELNPHRVEKNMKANEWDRLIVKVKIGEGFKGFPRANLFARTSTKTRHIDMKNFKIERGSEATPYSTAYEENIIEKIVVGENGTYTFTATDEDGNKTTKSIEVNNIDKKLPTIEVEEGETDKSVTEENSVRVVSKDKGGSGIKKVSYKIVDTDSGVVTGEGVLGSGDQKLQLPNQVGRFNIIVKATDGAGNQTEITSKTITIEGIKEIKVGSVSFGEVVLNGNEGQKAEAESVIEITDTRLRPGWNLQLQHKGISNEKNLLTDEIIVQGSKVLSGENKSISSGKGSEDVKVDLKVLIPNNAKMGKYTVEFVYTLVDGPI